MKSSIELFLTNLLYWFIEFLYWGAMLAVLILSILILTSCTKEEDEVCKTCDVNVKYWTATMGNQYYIESSKTYCNGGWTSVDGHTEIRSGTTHGVAWRKTSTTTCY